MNKREIHEKISKTRKGYKIMVEDHSNSLKKACQAAKIKALYAKCSGCRKTFEITPPKEDLRNKRILVRKNGETIDLGTGMNRIKAYRANLYNEIILENSFQDKKRYVCSKKCESTMKIVNTDPQKPSRNLVTPPQP